jgi:hypothetical protein
MPKVTRSSAAKPASPPARPAAASPGANRLAWGSLMLVAAACLVVSASFTMFDTDIWQHLVRAKAMLALHTIPRTNVWTWPLYGQPERNAAWAFALLVCPCWQLGSVAGLFVFRWLTMLAVFGAAWLVARRLGARGFGAVVVLVACAMVFRIRTQVRPEAIGAILLGLQLWILETRRQGGPDRAWWIVAIAWVWPDLHVSYYLGLLLTGLFALAELAPARRGRGGKSQEPAPPARRISLWLVLAASTLVSFVNPFGAGALSSPFEFFFVLRNESLYRAIGELQPIIWSINLRNGLPLLMTAWPLLQLWRWRRGRPDPLEAVLCAFFTLEAFTSQRFLGFWCVVAAPYLARDLADWMAARQLGATWSVERRAFAAALACVALTAIECTRSDLPLGIAIRPESYPKPACDFIASAGVRGRGFNYFEHGGYLLWRFWPERDRLPFMTTIPELATPEMRQWYARAMAYPEDWQNLSSKYAFDWVLLKRQVPLENRYQDFLDADSTYALVFFDDVSSLYVRRRGPMAAVAARFGYRWMAAGAARLRALASQAMASPQTRGELRAELERSIHSSPLSALAERQAAALDAVRSP